jgi:hypothetical protein
MGVVPEARKRRANGRRRSRSDLHCQRPILEALLRHLGQS